MVFSPYIYSKTTSLEQCRPLTNATMFIVTQLSSGASFQMDGQFKKSLKQAQKDTDCIPYVPCLLVDDRSNTTGPRPVNASAIHRLLVRRSRRVAGEGLLVVDTPFRRRQVAGLLLGPAFRRRVVRRVVSPLRRDVICCLSGYGIWTVWRSPIRTQRLVPALR